MKNKKTKLNIKSKSGATPLIQAVKMGINSMITTLIKNGANVNLFDNHQKTSLHWAALVSNFVALETLNNYGANIKAKDENKQTPLFLAVKESNLECVKILALGF